MRREGDGGRGEMRREEVCVDGEDKGRGIRGRGSLYFDRFSLVSE